MGKHWCRSFVHVWIILVLARISLLFSKKGVILIFYGVICKIDELSMNDGNCTMRRANGFEPCILHAQNIQNKVGNHFITSRSYRTWVCLNEVDIILP